MFRSEPVLKFNKSVISASKQHLCSTYKPIKIRRDEACLVRQQAKIIFNQILPVGK
jgi:hypothetical protein